MADDWARSYSGCSPDRLFTACVRTVTRLNWKIQHTDATTHTLSCAAKGKKKRLGGGQDMSLVVEAASAITEFSTGLNPRASLGRIAVGPDGNLWFGDKGTTPSIYVMNPTTHAITAFTTGLNGGSLPGGIWSGSDGNVWFTDQGAIRAIGRIGVNAPAASVNPSVCDRVGRSRRAANMRG